MYNRVTLLIITGENENFHMVKHTIKYTSGIDFIWSKTKGIRRNSNPLVR